MATVPFSDSFVGTNGSAWSANWTPHNSTGSTNTIVSNRGQMDVASSATTAWSRIDLTGLTMSTNFDISYDFYNNAGATTGNYTPLSLFCNSDNSNTAGQTPNNGIYIYLIPNYWAYNQLVLAQYTSGVSNVLANFNWTSAGANEIYSIRLRYLSNVFYARLWRTEGTETSSWGTYTPAAPITSGFISVSIGAVANQTNMGWIDNLNVFDPSVATTTPGRTWNVYVSAGDTNALIFFTAPNFDGGSAITSYTATITPGNIKVSGTTSPMYVSGLTNGTVYSVSIHATNINGDGLESTSFAFTPQSIYDVPIAWRDA